MCRADISPAAAVALDALFTAVRERLAVEWGCDPADITIGPCDLGPDKRISLEDGSPEVTAGRPDTDPS